MSRNVENKRLFILFTLIHKLTSKQTCSYQLTYLSNIPMCSRVKNRMALHLFYGLWFSEIELGEYFLNFGHWWKFKGFLNGEIG